MPDPQVILTQRFRDAVAAAVGSEHHDADPLIRPAQNPDHGDYQSNLAMSLAKKVGAKPRDLAQKVVEKLDWQGVCSEAPTIAGPGFINLRLCPAFVADALAASSRDAKLGVAPASPAQKVVLDYSGPNVAKEMHVGHLRSTSIGDAIARVLGFLGHEVKRQNHLGDWGTQFGRTVLGYWYHAMALRNGDIHLFESWIQRADNLPKESKKETTTESVDRRQIEDSLLDEMIPWHQARLDEDPDGGWFHEAYLKSGDFNPSLSVAQCHYRFIATTTELDGAKVRFIAHSIHGKRSFASIPSLVTTFIQNASPSERNVQERVAWNGIVKQSIHDAQVIYDRLSVSLQPEHVCGESFYDPMLGLVAAELEKLGVARISEGALCAFPPGFKGKEGEEVPLIVRKTDGGYGYDTTDLAAVRYRAKDLHAQRLIYVTDARQKQHFAMVFKTAEMAGWLAGVSAEHVPFGAVLGEDHKPFKTRSGDTVKLVDLLDEAEQRALKIIEAKNPELPKDERENVARVLGIGAVKYADLVNDRIKDYVFDWDRMLSFDGNTAPYLVNAYVRIQSIFRKAKAQGIDAGSASPAVSDPAEKALALKLLQFPGAVESVGQSLEPHRLCGYLYELASLYHQFYERCPVLTAETPALRDGRLALSGVTARTLKQGLELLGIGVLERM